MKKISINLPNYLRSFAFVADELDGQRRFIEADFIDELIVKIAAGDLPKDLSIDTAISKQADLSNYITPAYAADALRRVIYYMMYRAKVQNRDKFLESIKKCNCFFN